MYRKMKSLAGITIITLMGILGTLLPKSIVLNPKTPNSLNKPSTISTLSKTDSILSLADVRIDQRREQSDSLHNLVKKEKQMIHHLSKTTQHQALQICSLSIQIDSIKNHFKDSIQNINNQHQFEVKQLTKNFNLIIDDYQSHIDDLSFDLKIYQDSLKSVSENLISWDFEKFDSNKKVKVKPLSIFKDNN
jgi:hypothetical protein